MKIASWNVNSLRVRLDQASDWLNANDADILCLQELKMPDEEFPHEAFAELGYKSLCTGQKSYNGVAILSKHDMHSVELDLHDYEDPMRRYISCEVNIGERCIRIVNVYCPNGQDLESDKFVYKREWFSKLRETMRTHLIQNPNVVLVGDFNITPADIDVHNVSQWAGKIHCSDIERLMLQSLMSEGLYDTFRHFHSEGERFSWWDYRGPGYRANAGLRIDLVLSSAAMLDLATKSDIDESPRKLERPSDHTPVFADYQV